MQLFITIQGDGTIPLDVPPDSRIINVKERIFEITQIPIIEQALIFNGMILANNNTLLDYNIPNGATLLLVIRSVASCPTTAFQTVDLCVPIHVRPFATTGPPITRCCGSPTITPGTNNCIGMPIADCGFTVRQRICVEVPIDFGTETTPEEARILCGEASNNPNLCANCV